MIFLFIFIYLLIFLSNDGAIFEYS